MHPPSGKTLTLTPEQSERAKRLLIRIREGDVESPTDIVDVWDEPDNTIDWERKESLFPQERDLIPPSKIVGSAGMSNRLVKNRIKKVLAYMLKGELEVEPSVPPALQQRGDRFYVTSDGHHRCMAAKAIGLESLYVEYEIVPPELIVQPNR